MPLNIVRGDIVKMKVDAIVNTTNNTMQNSGGVCGAIFKAAGAGDLQRSCDQIGSCKTGSAVATEGFKLSKYIIHTVGPVWQGGEYGERNILYSCYRNSLTLAQKLECESIAFPLISSGGNGYPNEKALRVAIKAIGDFLLENDMDVILVLLKDTKFALSGEMHASIQKYINENYKDEQHNKISELMFEALRETAPSRSQPREPHDVKHDVTHAGKTDDSDASVVNTVFEVSRDASFSIDTLNKIANVRTKESFSDMLFRLIDERQDRFPKDSIVWRHANITRGVFNDIKNRSNHLPSKNTVLCLAVALELSLDLTLDLLMKAGYTFSDSSTRDLIVRYYISVKEYNIFRLNETLYQYGQTLLGSSMN